MEPFRLLTRISARYQRASRGFTLIEMIVVLAIITIIMAVILVSQTTFNHSLLLTDTAYTVALSVREVQTLGLSSEKYGATQNAGYGVDFAAGTPTGYTQYVDSSAGSVQACPAGTNGAAGTPNSKPGNCLYDPSSETFRKFAFNQGYTQSFCVYSHVGGSLIPGGCSGTTLSSLDIEFLRPNTAAIITATPTSGTPVQADTACITIKPPGSTIQKVIEVTSLGEIAVAVSCP